MIVPIRVESRSMKPLILGAAVLAAAMISASHAAEPPSSTPTPSKPARPAQPAQPAVSPDVQIITSLGNFIIELSPERAPLTVAQFLKYVDQGHYSGTIFHRAIANFVIQGGGYDLNFKLKGTPTKVVNESGNGLTNQRGTVGLARPAEPHEGDVQFYVNLADNAALDPNQARW